MLIAHFSSRLVLFAPEEKGKGKGKDEEPEK